MFIFFNYDAGKEMLENERRFQVGRIVQEGIGWRNRMNTIISKISIDVMRPTQTPVIYAVQGERDSRVVELSLTDDGSPWKLPSGAHLTVRYGRSTLSGGYYDTLPDGTAACSYKDNVITVVLAPQMTAEAGAVMTQVEILHADQLLTTFSFRLQVEINPAVGITQPETYVNWLQWMRNELEQYTERIIENGDFMGPAGPAGKDGAPATLLSTAVVYQAGNSGTTVPSGSWNENVPVVAQGKYLWTRITNTFNTGSPVVFYSVSRMGMDGSGSVTSVANISPDENGNIPLTAEHLGALSGAGGDLTGELKMNGQPISGLNQPAADDQVANKLYVDQQTKKAAPRNLLDNSNFRNPVNQRGESSYAGKIIGIDRWQGGAGAALVTVVDEGLKISCNEANGGTGTQPLMQYVNLSEGDAGKTVTFAARIKGGDVRIYFKGASLSYVNASDWTVIVYTGVIPANTEGFYVGLQGKNKSETLCEWMALYEGEYTVETLPEYQPKSYGAELAECQRYYQIVKYGYGSVKSDGTSVYTVLPLCVPMRKGSISVAKYSVASVRAVGLRFDSNKITGASLFDYQKDATAARVMVEGTFTGSENHIAYVDGTFHLSAEDL